jgi:hypothetical protein
MTEAEHYEEYIAKPRRQLREWALKFSWAVEECPDERVLDMLGAADHLGDYLDERRYLITNAVASSGMTLSQMTELMRKHYG